MKKNPYLSMLAIAWKYAHNQRRRYLLVYTMFMLSNIVMAMYPVIWGLFINAAQKEGVMTWRGAELA